MPGFDRTGPGGRGPMTGWGRGYCYGAGRPGSGRPGLGFGRGFGRGRGYRHRFWLTMGPGWGYRSDYPEMTREEEMKLLADEREQLEEELRQINREMEILKKEKGSAETEKKA